MTDGICQMTEALDADRDPPCLSCPERQGCAIYNGHRALIEESLDDLEVRAEYGIQAPPTLTRKMIVTAFCSKRGMDIRFSLMRAGVRNLCATCATARRRSCDTRVSIDGIDAAAAEDGQPVESWTISCYRTTPDHLVKIGFGDRLVQITEPRSR
jgi:hypothetical protein